MLGGVGREQFGGFRYDVLRILSACTLLGKDEGEGMLSGYFHWHHLFLGVQWNCSNNTTQRNATQCNATQRNATQSRAKQSKAEQSKAKQSKAKQSNATQRNATQRNTTQHKDSALIQIA